ncbi:MAG: winged helix-turn-helix domain-containing protein [Acidobacteria bacterium]|nr:winged helix-turn-helix domain-containing protein [Acidobacteriota bacterium]MBI3426254.1 winged helix-turn-helix domain-containing protein [Acidobacteriota bacterium]
MAKPASPLYEFGPFRLDPAERLLTRTGQPVALTPKAFDTLLLFVENQQRLLTKDELIAQIWPDSFVEESNLAQNVSAVRRALGEKAGGGHYIETVPKRGYRFVGEAKQVWAQAQRPAARPAYAPAQGEVGKAEALLDLNAQAAVETDEISSNIADAFAEDAPALTSLSSSSPGSSLASPPTLTAQPSRTSDRLKWFGLGMAALALLLAGWVFTRPNKSAPKAERPRLAVLPLRNLKPAPETDFLGFSLADAIITKLNYVSALTVRPSAIVAASVAAAVKTGQAEPDPQTISRELNVDKLLTGTFLKEGDDLRIHLQLIDVPNKQVLWAQPLDLKYDRLLTVQDRVTQQVLAGLRVNLTPIESEQLTRNAPRNPLAYEAYLRGLDAYQAADYARAISDLEQSTTLDPEYAGAWAHLGRAYTAQASFAFGGRTVYQQAQQAYEKALALNPQEIEARIFLANLFTDTGRVEEAVPQLRTVLKTNPAHAEAHWELGYAYRFGGLLPESIKEGELARQLDPHVKLNSSAFNSYLYAGQYDKFLQSLPPRNDQAFIVFYRGFAHYYLNQRTQAAEHFDRAYALDPSLYTQIGKALSAGLSNQTAQGISLLRDTERKLEAGGVIEAEGTYKVAQGYAVLGEKPAALRLLRRSIEGGFFCYPYFISDPLLENLRAEASYAQLMDAAKKRHEAFKQKFF